MIHAEPFIVHCNEGETITLRGMGDIHQLLRASDEDRFLADLKDRPTETMLYITLGDSLDSIGGTAHKYFHHKNIKEKYMLSDKPPLQAERDDIIAIWKEYTKPSERIGHLSGNHPLMQLSNGLDLMQDVCSQLGDKYLGYQAYVPIHFYMPRVNFVPLMLFAFHGYGGSGQRWEGSGMNAYISHSLRYEGWDIALYGHRHDKWVKSLPRMRPYYNNKTNRRWIKEDQKIIAQTGTYLKTLSDSVYPTYSEKSGMTPRPLGCITIQFKIVREKIDDGSESYIIKYLNI